MPLTITIDDPDTIALLMSYKQFIAEEDDVDGTLDQVAEGLMLGLLDGHPRFAAWHSVHTPQPLVSTIEFADLHFIRRTG